VLSQWRESAVALVIYVKWLGNDTFGRNGRSAPNLSKMGFPISFSLFVLMCFCKSCPVARTDEGVVGYVPIHCYNLLSDKYVCRYDELLQDAQIMIISSARLNRPPHTPLIHQVRNDHQGLQLRILQRETPRPSFPRDNYCSRILVNRHIA
jgi:hypothetical protein